MDIFCWNIRGFSDPVKRRDFKKWFKFNKPIFNSLIETHASPSKATAIVNRALPGWFLECNYEFSDLGKIWPLWHPSVHAKVISKSLQYINCLVKLPFVAVEFGVSMVYGSNCTKERRLLWSELETLASSP